MFVLPPVVAPPVTFAPARPPNDAPADVPPLLTVPAVPASLLAVPASPPGAGSSLPHALIPTVITSARARA
jgi:hypothetical protein